MQDHYQAAYDKAVDLLSRRMHTAAELRRKLRLKKFENEVITQVIQRLFELKVLNDQRFAEIFLDNLIKYKAFGYFGLKSKLMQRGIDTRIAEELLEANLPIETEAAIARKLLRKSSDSRDQLIMKLKRKGFRTQTITKVLSER